MDTIIGLLLLAFVGYAGWMFNRLVRDRNQVRAAWSDVDVQLQRRHDLVPRLVETVRGYAGHERELLARLASERSTSRQASGVAARGEIETALGGDLTRLIALAEAYPDLKASANFSQLSQELVDVEDALQHARRFYNGSVRQFNTHLERFPDVAVARLFRFQPAEFFAAEADARATPKVALP
ncbi:MAG TPA: LemA family protein [Rhodanobacteraceae bacterium]|nr:LemA family protein [Rhodanobacteraceae bacterium]